MQNAFLKRKKLLSVLALLIAFYALIGVLLFGFVVLMDPYMVTRSMLAESVMIGVGVGIAIEMGCAVSDTMTATRRMAYAIVTWITKGGAN